MIALIPLTTLALYILWFIVSALVLHHSNR